MCVENNQRAGRKNPEDIFNEKFGVFIKARKALYCDSYKEIYSLSGEEIISNSLKLMEDFDITKEELSEILFSKYGTFAVEPDDEIKYLRLISTSIHLYEFLSMVYGGKCFSPKLPFDAKVLIEAGADKAVIIKWIVFHMYHFIFDKNLRYEMAACDLFLDNTQVFYAVCHYEDSTIYTWLADFNDEFLSWLSLSRDDFLIKRINLYSRKQFFDYIEAVDFCIPEEKLKQYQYVWKVILHAYIDDEDRCTSCNLYNALTLLEKLNIIEHDIIEILKGKRDRILKAIEELGMNNGLLIDMLRFAS